VSRNNSEQDYSSAQMITHQTHQASLKIRNDLMTTGKSEKPCKNSAFMDDIKSALQRRFVFQFVCIYSDPADGSQSINRFARPFYQYQESPGVFKWRQLPLNKNDLPSNPLLFAKYENACQEKDSIHPWVNLPIFFDKETPKHYLTHFRGCSGLPLVRKSKKLNSSLIIIRPELSSSYYNYLLLLYYRYLGLHCPTSKIKCLEAPNPPNGYPDKHTNDILRNCEIQEPSVRP
jgi:hypothetical protein